MKHYDTKRERLIFCETLRVLSFVSDRASCAIIYVVAELLGVARRFKAPELVMWGLLLGFLLGYATDLIVTFGGA